MDIFAPHFSRDAATSAVLGKVPIDTIIPTAAWKSDCVFRTHYNRPITNDIVFSATILDMAN